MGVIAWIVPGLGTGLLANMLIPGRRSQGLTLTCVTGAARRRPGWRGPRRETAAASQDRDDLTGQRDTARSCTASRTGNGDGDASPWAGRQAAPARRPDPRQRLRARGMTPGRQPPS
jgi:hypothetical protein